jgi:perosamine synthetase
MIRFAKPHFEIESREDIFDRLQDVLDSGWLTNGSTVREVENFFSHLLEGRYVAATNSCTASLHLAMILAGISKNDEVILPSNTFVSTANSVLFCEGIPIFAEIDPKTLNIDPLDVEQRITERTKAIVTVHLTGKPCDMRAFTKICEEHELILIEDCAHAHGSRIDGKYCGTFGDFACFSFYPTKVISSSEGGLLVTSHKDKDEKARLLLNQGRSGIGPSSITEIGYNYRMNELQAILIAVQMHNLENVVKIRNKMAERYKKNLKSTSGIEMPMLQDNETSSYYSFPIRLLEAPRNVVQEKLQKEGIEASIMYNPVHLQPAYRNLFDFKPGMLPITEMVCSQLLNLPLHLGMSNDDIDIVCEKLLLIINQISNE